MLRVILAVLAGFATMGIAALCTGMILGRFYPVEESLSTRMLLLILTYTLLCCALGGYVSARIAPERNYLAPKLLAVLITVLTVVNLAIAPGSAPLWWKVLGGALSGPFAFLGGLLYSAAGAAGARRAR